MYILLKAIYKFKLTPIKITMVFFEKLKKFLKFIHP